MNWTIVAFAVAAVTGIAGFAAGASLKPAREDRFFEMRTYTASPGKIQALHARFRDHTCKLFEKHGMTNLGYWQAVKGTHLEHPENTLVYILAYPSKEAREASWKAFTSDEEWKKVKAESEKDGIPLAANVDSVFLTPTDYSAIK